MLNWKGMLLLWWNCRHWLHRKLYKSHLSVQPVTTISPKWHFRFSVWTGLNCQETALAYIRRTGLVGYRYWLLVSMVSWMTKQHWHGAQPPKGDNPEQVTRMKCYFKIRSQNKSEVRNFIRHQSWSYRGKHTVYHQISILLSIYNRVPL